MRYAGLATTAFLVVAVSGALFAQADRGEAKGRIQVDVVVTDAAGKPVSGLSQQDFKLLDDGKASAIASFAAYDGVRGKADPPTQMILVIDSVNNGFVESGYIRQGLTKFLRQNNGQLAVPMRIARLTASGVQFLSHSSTDGNALASIVDQIGASTKPTGLNSFSLSLKALADVVNQVANDPGRKMVIWLGPGWPVHVPGPNVVTAIEQRGRRIDFHMVVAFAKAMQEARITLYGGYRGANFYMRDYLKPVRRDFDASPRDLALEVLAAKSGGHGELPAINRDSAVSDVLNSFVAEASTFYSLSFDPPQVQGDGEFHVLKVAVDKPGLRTRTISGYYDEAANPANAPQKQTAIPVPHPAVEEPSAQPVSVAQLAAIVQGLKTKRDAAAAKELERLQLTERLSSSKLATLSGALPGAKAKSALMAVGDASVFLEPPGDEIPQKPAPGSAEQQQMMAKVVEYLKQIIPKLPNFYAKRLTTSFEEELTPDEKGRRNPVGLQPAGQFKATVYVQKGKEVVRADGDPERGLITRGTFGPILSTVIVDAAYSHTTQWSRWEEGPKGLMAVFRFDVPQQESHYEAAFKPAGEAGLSAANATAYHGEIGVDPNTGAILRLMLQAFGLGTGMSRADIMVEYGAVGIGEKVYTCPVRSVSIATGGSTVLFTNMGLGHDREVTRLNDVVFSDYHVFRSDFKIVPYTP